jgi:D-alanyl-D-alanine carboxypeptidase
MWIRKLRVTAWCAAAAAFMAAPAAQATQVQPQLQHLIDSYLAGRAAIEGNSGVALRVEEGGAPPIALFAGNDGLPQKRKIDGHTLFQIGSNTKLFTAVLILQLEAEGRLTIDQTVGDFLPQYPAWKHVTIRSLLDMTSKLPNYSETISVGRIVAADLHHQFSDADLIAAVYPGSSLPRPAKWFYSNTNNILAALIIETVTHMSFHDALDKYIVHPLRLTDTTYPVGETPPDVVARLPRGLYENAACQLYQPAPCKRPVLGPVVGKDMRTQNLSWAGAAGAVISTPRDLEIWLRALFGGHVLKPKQFTEMTTLVSSATGLPIADVDAQNPRGFGLDVAKIYDAQLGTPFWFYQGETMGYRVVFAYYPKSDLLITGATNSQPPEGQDQFAKTVLGGAAGIMAK